MLPPVAPAVPAASDLLSLAENGLPALGGSAKKVVVIGAGMAGLVAAQALLRAGHEILLLEAQARVGGRVQTLREPFTDGLYAEAGAMRIPRSHALTLSYLRRFGVATSPFTAANRQAYYYLHGHKRRIADVECDPDLLSDALGEHERGKPFTQWWECICAPPARRTGRMNVESRLRSGGRPR